MKKKLPLAFVLLMLLASLCFGQANKNKGAQSSANQGMKTNSLEATLMAQEQALWQAWKEKKAAPFQEWLADDAVLVGDSGTEGKAQVVKEATANDCTINSFSFSDVKVTIVDKDAALLTFKAAQDGVCGGTAIPKTVAATSLYVKRGNKWLAMFHQESPWMQHEAASSQQ